MRFSTKILLAVMLAANLSFLAGYAFTQCRGGSCGGGSYSPAMSPVLSPVAAQTGAAPRYQWKVWPSDPDSYYLHRDGVQIGGWSVRKQQYRALLDYNRDYWGEPQAEAIDHVTGKSVTLTAEMLRPRSPVEKKDKLEAWQLGGVVAKEIGRVETYSVNGQHVGAKDALDAIGNPNLSDDSGKLFLSVWSKDPAKRAQVIADLKANPELWRWATERCHIWAGDAAHPDHFLAKDREGKPLYAIDGEPTIMLQTPDGVELWHDAGYTHGPASLELMRKSDPAYTPDKTPGPRSPIGPGVGSDANLLSWILIVAGVFGGIWFFTRTRE